MGGFLPRRGGTRRRTRARASSRVRESSLRKNQHHSIDGARRRGVGVLAAGYFFNAIGCVEIDGRFRGEFFSGHQEVIGAGRPVRTAIGARRATGERSPGVGEECKCSRIDGARSGAFHVYVVCGVAFRWEFEGRAVTRVPDGHVAVSGRDGDDLRVEANGGAAEVLSADVVLTERHAGVQIRLKEAAVGAFHLEGRDRPASLLAWPDVDRSRALVSDLDVEMARAVVFKTSAYIVAVAVSRVRVLGVAAASLNQKEGDAHGEERDFGTSGGQRTDHAKMIARDAPDSGSQNSRTSDSEGQRLLRQFSKAGGSIAAQSGTAGPFRTVPHRTLCQSPSGARARPSRKRCTCPAVAAIKTTGNVGVPLTIQTGMLRSTVQALASL